MKTVSVDEMGNAIQKEFEEYVEHTADEVKKIVKEVADDVTKEIQSRAPVDTGAYKKSWTATQTKNTALAAEYTVHSEKHYRLTHLLEYGHAKRGGGRTEGRPHIAPVEEMLNEQYFRKVEESL